MAADASPLRTLIVDDEPLAVERMQLLCANMPTIALVGTAQDGEAALRLIAGLHPDLVLLDIGMPSMDGIAVARAVAAHGTAEGMIPASIIFVTAFDGFAVEAFDLSAVDYVLKPVSPERLERAIGRVYARRGNYTAADADKPSYAGEFWVPHRAELIRVAAAEIDRIDAERDYMRLHVGARSWLLHQTITALEARLDPAIFIRLHRSTIVRRDRIQGLGHDGLGGWHADLVDGSQVRIGRTYLSAAKAMAGR
jgi:DNA-binding LytR/AlgR family response regulator